MARRNSAAARSGTRKRRPAHSVHDVPNARCRTACLLTRELLARVERSITVHRHTTSATELARLLKTGDFQLCIFDPSIKGCTEALLAVLPQASSLVAVAYTQLDPHVVPSLLQLTRAGIADVIIFGDADPPERFAALRDRATVEPYAEAVLAELRDTLARLPETLRLAIHELYKNPTRIRGPEDLAASAGLTRTALYRLLEQAGIQSCRLLLTSARVVRAVGLLQDPQLTPARVAHRLSYYRTERLNAAVHDIVGHEPADLRLVEPRTLAAVVSARLFRGDDEQPGPPTPIPTDPARLDVPRTSPQLLVEESDSALPLTPRDKPHE